MTQVNHTVVRGETLSTIARKYTTTVSNIALLNDLSVNSRLFIGQVLIIRNKTISGNKPQARAANKYTVDITGMGLQSNSDNTIFITWSFKTPNTESYEIEWGYSTADGKWYNGGTDTCQNDIYGNIPKESTYSLPSNGVSARARVKPVSKTYKDNKGNEVSYWQGQWSGWKTYSSKNNPPGIPPVPTVEIDKYTMKIRNDNLDTATLNATEIAYQVVQNDGHIYKTVVVPIKLNRAYAEVTITPSFRYKVRAKSKRGNTYSEWGEFTDNNESIPSAPKEITLLTALSDTSVKIGWEKIASAKTYSIEYTEKYEYFDGSNATTVIDGIETPNYVVTGLNKGTKYHFRVKSVNDTGSSGWCKSKSIIIGTKPEPPSTWSDRTIAIIGEKVILSWLHNTVDGSEQKQAQIEITVNDKTTTHSVGMDSNDKPIDTFELETSQYIDGTKINWRVRTKGILEEYSDWSIQRLIEVYAPPTLSTNILDENDQPINTVLNFPFTINAIAGPQTQTPIMYAISIKSKDAYITQTPFGDVHISVDEEIYNKILNSNEDLNLKLTAGDIDLENGINYEAEVRVTMDSGLSAESISTFNVDWTDVISYPNAEVLLDDDRLSASIRPYCERYEDLYMVVEFKNGKYYTTEDELSDGFQNATSVEGAKTTDGKQVYKDDKNRLFCILEAGKVIQVTDVYLSVYRRTHDGKFVEISDKIAGDADIFITDPHPSMGYARYRIVSTDYKTGAVSYTDISPKSFDEESIVIQWEENWTSFTTDGENFEDVDYTSGSLIKLPYNISVSENNSPDVSAVSYIGREHPVSYYGTALSTSSSVSSEFDKDDNDMKYALRRLSVYMGDSYIRLPSGVGYWANIKVSFDDNYDSLVIPVKFDVLRVQGGI